MGTKWLCSRSYLLVLNTIVFECSYDSQGCATLYVGFDYVVTKRLIVGVPDLVHTPDFHRGWSNTRALDHSSHFSRGLLRIITQCLQFPYYQIFRSGLKSANLEE